MIPKSPGRTPKWTPAEIKQAWKNLRVENPTASKTDLAKLLNISVSRVRAILNSHPSELQRKQGKVETQQAPIKEAEVKSDTDKPKKQGLMYFPNGWGSF